MDLQFLVTAALMGVGLILRYLAWRHPRPAPPSVADQRKDEEETAEGIALLLGSLWVARNRRKAKSQQPGSN